MARNLKVSKMLSNTVLTQTAPYFAGQKASKKITEETQSADSGDVMATFRQARKTLGQIVHEKLEAQTQK